MYRNHNLNYILFIAIWQISFYNVDNFYNGKIKMELKELPNISNVLSAQLLAVGINSAEQLREIGAEKAIIMLVQNRVDVCHNKACAIEGAIQNIRWHNLDKDSKNMVKAILSNIKLKY